MPASTPKLDDLFLTSKLDSSQLERITAELDVLIVALAALTPLDRVRMQQVAHDLQLELLASEWINAWSVERPRADLHLNIQQIRALVLMVNELARAHQDPIRRNLAAWQQTIDDNRLPLQSLTLADYLSNFMTIYQARANDRDANESFEVLSVTALNLLVGLLFYSSPNGHQRLWAALLKRSH